MALRNILQKDDPTLAKIARQVTDFDDRLHTLLDDMRDTMYAAPGVGLAAPQIGVLRRVALVLDIQEVGEDEFKETLIELINPEILEQDGEQEGVEGCLSVLGVMGRVIRPNRVRVRAQDRHGEFFELTATDFTARVVCHELDHLDGKLYTRLCDELFEMDSDAEDETEGK